MQGLIYSYSAELLKAKRAKVFWMTMVACIAVPVMCGFMMWVIMNPELATNLNLVKAKADILISKADWPSFFVMLLMVVAMGGIIIFGFVASWVFGREYTDHTIKDILALPVSRTTVILSKFMVIVSWCFFLSLLMFLTGIITGIAIHIPGFSTPLLLHNSKIFLITAFLTILLSFPVSFFACTGRGYLSPLGFVIFMIALSQFIAHLGWGAYFPWSIPALYTGVAGPKEAQLGSISFIIIIVTGMIGLTATILWWRFKDQK